MKKANLEARQPEPNVPSPRRSSPRLLLAAAVILVALAGLGVAEATGGTTLTDYVATVLRLRTPEGTLVVEVDDPEIKVSVDTDGKEIVITGAGVHEIRLRPGDHQLKATRDGVVLKDEFFTISRNGRQVVKVSREGNEQAKARTDDKDRRIRALQEELAALKASMRPTALLAEAVKQSREEEQAKLARLKFLEDRIDREQQAVNKGLEFLNRIQGQPREKLVISTGRLWSIAFSPDGKSLAAGSGSWDSPGRITLWDVATGQLRAKADEKQAVRSLAFSPDGRFLATAEFDRTAKLWDGATLRTVRIFDQATNAMNAVAFSPDGKVLAGSDQGGAVHVWDVVTGKKIWLIRGDADGAPALAFSPDGRSLVVGSTKRTAVLWDMAAQPTKRAELQGHQKPVESLAFSPDGKVLATGSRDRTVRLWDAATGKEVRALAGHSISVLSVAFSPDGRILASSSGVWDDPTAPVENPGPGEVILWDIASGKQLATLKGHTDRVWSVAFSPDGKTLATADWSGVILLWDMRASPSNPAQPEDPRLQQLQEEVRKLRDEIELLRRQQKPPAYHPDGDQTVPPQGQNWESRVLQKHGSKVTSVRFTPDGKRIASGDEDGAVRLWDVATGEEIRLARVLPPVTSLALSPDGRSVLTGTKDKTFYLLDLHTGALIRRFEGHAGPVLSVASSPDGKLAGSGSEDHTARLWDVATGKQIWRMDGHDSHINTVTFSPDGKWLISGSRDGSICIWGVATGKLLLEFKGENGGALSKQPVAVAPDGQTILSGHGNGRVRLWDAHSGLELRVFAGHTDRVESVAFSPDGRRLVSSSYDKTVRLWDAVTGKALAVLKLEASLVLTLTFSPDGRFLVYGGDDGVWILKIPEGAKTNNNP